MLLAQLLKKWIRQGTFVVVDADGRTHRFVGSPQPSVTIRLHDPALHRKLFTNPRLHFGQAYMDGTLTLEQGTLADMLDILGRNHAVLDDQRLDILAHRVSQMSRSIQQYNPAGRAQKNAAHHYDLSDTLYDLFLDRDRQYSCAYFTTDNDSIDVAQDNKKRHIAAKLLLQPGMKVLDIGSGWGGLGLYLAKVADVDVTGVTLSTEQHKVSEARAREEGLADRVHFYLQDYRRLTDRFDRIVSVGMFEHVGARHYREFFAKLKELLSDDGVALLHSIGRMEPPGTTSPWIKKYIFPGSYTPALSEVLAAVENTRLWVTDIEILRRHYARTLHEWNRSFQKNRDEIEELYDERFCRMWEFYLQSCEMAFHHMDLMVFQMQLAKRQDAVPDTREYVREWEHANAGEANIAV